MPLNSLKRPPYWNATTGFDFDRTTTRVGLLQDVANRIQQRRMQYFGHVQRMAHTKYAKLALHGYVHGTKR